MLGRNLGKEQMEEQEQDMKKPAAHVQQCEWPGELVGSEGPVGLLPDDAGGVPRPGLLQEVGDVRGAGQEGGVQVGGYGRQAHPQSRLLPVQ